MELQLTHVLYLIFIGYFVSDSLYQIEHYTVMWCDICYVELTVFNTLNVTVNEKIAF